MAATVSMDREQISPCPEPIDQPAGHIADGYYIVLTAWPCDCRFKRREINLVRHVVVAAIIGPERYRRIRTTMRCYEFPHLLVGGKNRCRRNISRMTSLAETQSGRFPVSRMPHTSGISSASGSPAKTVAPSTEPAPTASCGRMRSRTNQMRIQGFSCPILWQHLK